MSDYRAPVKDMRFVMDELAGYKELTQYPDFAEATPDLADAILEEAAKFAGEVLAPLNHPGDKQGCKLTAHGVTTPTGWKEAYQQFCAAGWNGVSSPADFGGQGLPDTLGVAVKEMVCSANLSFSLGPLLTTGAVEALLTCASEELKAIYLEKMVTGVWTGTMNLTEPQAGSDLASVSYTHLDVYKRQEVGIGMGRTLAAVHHEQALGSKAATLHQGLHTGFQRLVGQRLELVEEWCDERWVDDQQHKIEGHPGHPGP